MRRLFILLLCSAILSGCVSASDHSLVCPDGDLRYGERTQLEIYLVPDRMHRSFAVALSCPNEVLVLEARMLKAEARDEFWTRVNSIEPSKGVIPTGRVSAVAEVRPSTDSGGLPTLEIHEVVELEAAFPPPQIAATLGLDSQDLQ